MGLETMLGNTPFDKTWDHYKKLSLLHHPDVALHAPAIEVFLQFQIRTLVLTNEQRVRARTGTSERSVSYDCGVRHTLLVLYC
jgi:hypothetical protein